MKNRIFVLIVLTGAFLFAMPPDIHAQGTKLSSFPEVSIPDTGHMNFIVVDNSSGSAVDKQLSMALFSNYLTSSIHLLAVTDSAQFATRLRVQKAIDSLNGILALIASGSDSSQYTTKKYRQKGVDSLNGIIAGIVAGNDSVLYSTKAYRQKGMDSLNNIVGGIAAGSDSSLYSTKAYRQKGMDSLNNIVGGIIAGSDSVLYSTKTYRQKGVDSLNGIIGGLVSGNDSTLYSTKAYRQKAVDSLNGVIGGYTPLSNYNSQSGTTYTLQASDKGKVVSFSSSSSITLTVPSGLGATFYCVIQQMGTGQVTATASSTTLANADGFTKTKGQYAEFSITFTPTVNTYVMQGEMQ